MLPITDPLETSDDGMLLSRIEFINALTEKIVPLEALDIEADLFFYWRKKGLLPFFQKGAWARFSFAQVIWIHMLQDLREFGYSFKKMQALTEYLFKRAYDDNLPQQIIALNIQGLKKKQMVETINDEEKKVLSYLEDLRENEAMELHLKRNINYLTNLITYSLKYGEETGLLLFIDGQIAEFKGGMYSSVDSSEVDPSKPHIYLSMRHYCKPFVDKKNLEQIVSPLQNYLIEEQKVLRAIRHPNTREVRIDVRDGKVQRVESTSGGTISGEQVQKIRDILGLKNYEKITLDSMDEKSLLYKKTKKKLF